MHRREANVPAKPVLYEEVKGIARITFNRPDALNAMDRELLLDVSSLLDEVKANDAVKALIVTGAGEKAFSAGADIAFAQSPPAVRMTWEAIHRGLNLTLEESALLGADYFGLVAATSDFREGTRAFLEKTSPFFTGS